MIKLLTIALLLAPIPALAEEDWQESLRRGADYMDRMNENTRRQIHDMNMESSAHRQEIEMYNQNVTQQGIRDEMMMTGNSYWR